MVDLNKFRPDNLNDFVGALEEVITGVASDWWKANSGNMLGYLESLSEAVLETTNALDQRRVSPETADQAFRMQQAAFRQTIRFTRFMTYVLAQQVVNAVFKLVSAIVRNFTGLNFFPELLKD